MWEHMILFLLSDGICRCVYVADVILVRRSSVVASVFATGLFYLCKDLLYVFMSHFLCGEALLALYVSTNFMKLIFQHLRNPCFIISTVNEDELLCHRSDSTQQDSVLLGCDIDVGCTVPMLCSSIVCSSSRSDSVCMTA